MSTDQRIIGYTCSYTPLPLLHAAGAMPYRVLPMTGAPDQAGSLLHDNLCPEVKRLLDRALAGDLPQLIGMVFVNSCDAMRRLADAWRVARPDDPCHLVDLPISDDETSIRYLATELALLKKTLRAWTGQPVDDESLLAGATTHNRLAEALIRLEERAARGTLPGGWKTLQELRNRAVTTPAAESLAELERVQATPEAASQSNGHVPLLITGNVLPDPDAFELLASCGATPVADDLCTGSRQLLPLSLRPECGDELLLQLARQLLGRPPCARTVPEHQTGNLARQVIDRAAGSGARGVLLHVMKFCDPYLARLPALRAACKEAGLPVLVLEGDCSMRSLGQHRTRIEAFVEMLS